MKKEYDSYTRVDQKWVEEIPSHWRMRRLKCVLALRKERNTPLQTNYILSLSAKYGVVPYAEKGDIGGNKSKDDPTEYNICHKNDLLVNCMNVIFGSAGVSKYFGAISPVYYAFYPRENDNIWYYHYVFRLVTFQRSLVGLGKGILNYRMRISMNYLGNVLLPIPPREEQDRIVRFLDWKASEINKLILNQKKEIGFLEELTKKVISDVVTKGVNPKVAYIASNVNWIGLIPRHWKIVKAKRVVNITNGSDPIGNGNIPVYGSGGAFKTCGEFKEPPAVLLGRKGTINRPQFVDCKYWNVDTAFDVHTKSDLINLKYYYYCAFLFDYDFYMTQTALPSMTQTDYGNMSIPLPPLNEQIEIIKTVEHRLDLLRMLVKEKKAIIDNLHELKNRIISDVVTGKTDVRGIVIPEYVDTELCDVESENVI